MLEASVAAFIAVFTGLAALHSRVTGRIDAIERRIDQAELKVAEKYVPRQELQVALQKFEDHMIRIENKLDQMLLRNG